MIAQPPNRHLVEPATWIGRNAGDRPLPRGGDECFLHGVFCIGEVTVPPRDDAQHVRREVAQQLQGVLVERTFHYISVGGTLMTGRTSTPMFIGLPRGPGAAETFAASS